MEFQIQIVGQDNGRSLDKLFCDYEIDEAIEYLLSLQNKMNREEAGLPDDSDDEVLYGEDLPPYDLPNDK